LKFKIISECKHTGARTGKIYTDHGVLETPFFMPVGTYGSVKTQTSEEIKDLPSKILLSNTYHLFLRPSMDIMTKAKGLHNFMNWDGAILTDSGGYQIYSLEGHRTIDSDGVTFKSHYDGSMHRFTPEKIIDIQRIIGSDLMMVLDVCPSGKLNLKDWKEAVQLTTNWAYRSYEQYNKTETKYGHKQSIIPIIQGGTNKELRIQSAKELLDLDLENYAIGGLAVGEPKEAMLKTTEWMNDIIPREKSKYLMGVGTPVDLIECIRRGVDMFDCVIPTRNARNSQLFTHKGKINIKNAQYKDDHSIIDTNSTSVLSQKYTKAYLHHLFRMNEILGLRISTAHNLHFYINLMKTVKLKIEDGTFNSWSAKFIDIYNKGRND
tara:strand:- start:50 stop:1183 length:1134 start_codon:yes stop_codon:yes gene_type:complete